jgi:hypothetical protein
VQNQTRTACYIYSKLSTLLLFLSSFLYCTVLPNNSQLLQPTYTITLQHHNQTPKTTKMFSAYLQIPSATVPSTSFRKTKAEPQSALRASSYPHIKIKIESPSTPIPTIKNETPQTPTPHIKVEPQGTPRLSSYPDHQMALSSTNLWIEAPETPAPKIKSEPQSTPRLSGIPHGLPHLSPQRTLEASITPHTRTHLAPKNTLELSSSPLSP